MSVLLRGEIFCCDPSNKDEAIQMHVKVSGSPKNVIEEGWHLYYGRSIEENSAINEGYVKDMESYTRFLHSEGRIKNPQDPLDYTYTGFLKELKPELVKVEGRWQP
jgi:hypothetical protein